MPERAKDLLIVDDEASTRTALAHIFSRLGYSVRCAENGLCALRMIRERLPDVMLSDLQMPEMSGFELLSVVRRRLPGIYVIAMSGAYFGNDVPHGIAADAFYQKASGIASLLKLMEVGMDVRRPHPYRSTPQVPLWVTKSHTNGSNETCVLIGCPDCMRSFEAIAEGSGLIHEAICGHCMSRVHYAIVHSNGPFPPQGVLGCQPVRRVTSVPQELLRGLVARGSEILARARSDS
jgi:CheY-like chemotaxis protein